MTDTKWTPPDSVVVREGHGPNTYLLATPKRKAADELYEALKRCRNLLRHIHTGEKSEFIDEVNDTLAKARGES